MLSASDILEKKARLCKEKGQGYYRLCKKYQELTEFYFKKADTLLDCVHALKEIEVKEDENSCPICYSSYKIYIHGSCDHKVCINCYSKFKSTEKCPLCRESFSNVFEKGINECTLYKEIIEPIEHSLEQSVEQPIEHTLQPPILIYSRNSLQRTQIAEQIFQNHAQQLNNTTLIYNPEEQLEQYD